MSDISTGTLGAVDWNTITGYTGEETEESSDLLDKEVFMELLITQLQNQDPLSPMENEDFTAQLAQLTQVEELRAANTNLETLQLYQASINNAQSVSMIGKSVKALGNVVQYEGSDVDLTFTLPETAATVRVTVYGADGDAVRSYTMTDMEAGLNRVKWNGRDTNGNEMTEGEYTFSVSATDEDGESIEVQALIEGIVKGVSFESGAPLLEVNGQKVAIGDIYEVSKE